VGLGGGLAVHAGAVVGLGGHLSVGVEDLDGSAGVLGALRGQQPTVGQRHRDPVMRILGRGLLEHVELAVAERGGIDHGDLPGAVGEDRDRKSTRLNSSHVSISYAVFCLKKKKNVTS